MYKYVEAGECDSLITIERLQTDEEASADAYGNKLRLWVSVQAVWARIRLMSAREIFAGEQAISEATHEIICRDPLTGITPAMRAVVGSEAYLFLSANLIPNASRPRNLRIEAKHDPTETP